jgi:hypothetical protein
MPHAGPDWRNPCGLDSLWKKAEAEKQVEETEQ